ncbi:MAG: multidrug effflux MFS transporter [Minwuia sp.]|uniref:multidrug effflux MFS transporter n=1 Tax=Minwuia sp. TaxID=2493630 RepID=UPI003A8597C5
MTTTTDGPVSKVQATAFMIGLLAALSAIGQFATNIYLPSLPVISAELSASPSQAQLTLTLYLAAFAFTQLLYGPLSDRFGRRIILMSGLAIFIAGSVVCTIAQDIDVLIAGRILQAVGGGGCTVAARAVVRDSFEGPALQKVMALIAILFALVPGLSPLFGALLQELAGWRTIFIVTGGVGAVVALMMVTRLPETLAYRLPKLNPTELVRGYAIVLARRDFLRFALPMSLIFTAMFAFFGGSPYTFIEFLDVSATEYGFYPPLASTGFVIGGIVVRRLTGRMSTIGICGVGLVVAIAACAIGVVLPLAGWVHKAAFIVSVIVFVASLGIFLPTAMAAALQLFPERAGTASAMLGFLQMAGGVLGSAMVAAFQEQFPIFAYATIMLAACIGSAVLFMLLRPSRG